MPNNNIQSGTYTGKALRLANAGSRIAVRLSDGRVISAIARNNINAAAVSVLVDGQGRASAFNPAPARVTRQTTMRFFHRQPRPQEEETPTFIGLVRWYSDRWVKVLTGGRLQTKFNYRVLLGGHREQSLAIRQFSYIVDSGIATNTAIGGPAGGIGVFSDTTGAWVFYEFAVTTESPPGSGNVVSQTQFYEYSQANLQRSQVALSTKPSWITEPGTPSTAGTYPLGAVNNSFYVSGSLYRFTPTGPLFTHLNSGTGKDEFEIPVDQIPLTGEFFSPVPQQPVTIEVWAFPDTYTRPTEGDIDTDGFAYNGSSSDAILVGYIASTDLKPA